MDNMIFSNSLNFSKSRVKRNESDDVAEKNAAYIYYAVVASTTRVANCLMPVWLAVWKRPDMREARTHTRMIDWIDRYHQIDDPV